jgi:hypothetical protein
MIKKRQMKKRIFSLLLTGTLTLAVSAQVSNTLSPYSQFGMGVLSDQSQGFNRGMGGVAMGLRDGKIVNMQNPASYSAIDSLTMILDAGVSGQITNFKEGGKKVNAKTGHFDYAVALFRVMPKMGVSVGVVPFSNIGYSYTNYEQENESLLTVTTYNGSGGFSQAFLGVGYEVVRGLSVGANFSYFWGHYNRSVVPTQSISAAMTQSLAYEANVSSYKLDFGVQYQKELNKKEVLTVGATVGLGHRLSGDALFITSLTDPQGATFPPDTLTVRDAFRLPLTIGVGATLLHNSNLLVGLDYSLQNWGNVDYPAIRKGGEKTSYELTSGLLRNRHKIAVGVDWLPSPNPMTRKFFKRVHYRAGISYATPYYKIGTHDGPKELTLSAGFAIPIINTWNNRSTLNVTAQWVHASAKDFVTENTFRLTLGLTFNERWFAKWKVD